MAARDEPTDLSSMLDEFIGTTTQSLDPPIGRRYLRIRSGPREPMCRLIRWLVWHRDGGRCRLCGSCSAPEVDHVIPWSAGGSDDGTNLRLLCQGCNRSRKNYRLREDPRLLAVAHTCDHCLFSIPVEPYPYQSKLLHEHRCLSCVPALGPGSDEVDRDPLRSVFCGHCLAVSAVTNELRVLRDEPGGWY